MEAKGGPEAELKEWGNIFRLFQLEGRAGILSFSKKRNYALHSTSGLVWELALSARKVGHFVHLWQWAMIAHLAFHVEIVVGK